MPIEPIAPAFPNPEMGVSHFNNPGAYSGLTAQEYAAIMLRVPESGTPWLDDMIRKARRDYFAAQVQADDRLVKCIRAMDDSALAMLALYPSLEREDWLTETKHEDIVGTPWSAMSEVGKVAHRLQLEARAIAKVRYMHADAMLAAREVE